MGSPKSCRRKLKYKSELAARSALLAMRRGDDMREPEKLSVYECRWCAGWHIGHLRPLDRLRRVKLFKLGTS